MKYICILFLLLLNVSVFAQDHVQYSQHINLQGLINPAYNGSRESYSILGVNRIQWGGVANTYALNAHAPLPINGMGAGLVFTQDEFGLYGNLNVSGALSYRIELTTDLTLAAGIQGGLFRQQVSDPNPENSGDNSLRDFASTTNSFTTGFGFFLYSQKYFVGFSMPEILPGIVSLDESPIMLYGGYLIEAISDVTFKPTLFIEATPSSPLLIQLGLYVYAMDIFSFGVATRTYPFSSLILSTEIEAVKHFYFGYSYDVYFGSEGNMGQGSHEISLRYDVFTRDLLSKRSKSIRYF